MSSLSEGIDKSERLEIFNNALRSWHTLSSSNKLDRFTLEDIDSRGYTEVGSKAFEFKIKLDSEMGNDDVLDYNDPRSFMNCAMAFWSEHGNQKPMLFSELKSIPMLTLSYESLDEDDILSVDDEGEILGEHCAVFFVHLMPNTEILVQEHRLLLDSFSAIHWWNTEPKPATVKEEKFMEIIFGRISCNEFFESADQIHIEGWWPGGQADIWWEEKLLYQLDSGKNTR